MSTDITKTATFGEFAKFQYNLRKAFVTFLSEVGKGKRGTGRVVAAKDCADKSSTGEMSGDVEQSVEPFRDFRGSPWFTVVHRGSPVRILESPMRTR